MPAYETFVTCLLRTYHGGLAAAPDDHSPITARQIRYLTDVGLGPIAFVAYGEVLRATDSKSFAVLQSADLTVRVIYKQLENATVELLASLQGAGITPVLLKGISTSFELYSPPHFRLMGDIDILVQPFEVNQTMSTLADLGYEIADEAWRKYRERGHHHLPAARNPRTGTTVEVHTALFPSNLPISKEPVFRAEIIEAQTLEFDYKGVRAARFTPEFQLVFTTSHWGIDGNWAVNLTSINDAIHILRKYETELNWPVLTDWLSVNPWLYANVAALVAYLERANIFAMPRQMPEALEKTGHKLRPATMRTLVWLLHNYPFNARETFHDDYAIARARLVWRDLTRPDSRDILIPFSVLRAMLRYIHGGKFNPLGWLLSMYRKIASRITPDR